tara:strand:- start:100 stop:534 length:435 start_codon:yes stop_codon:yes gene_type:complete
MQHRFVEFMPEELEEGMVYISPEYCTVIHLCACGCREEVSTPLSPIAWELNFDGKYISLSPSIGNWSYKCRSHYWIKKNKVVWADNWSELEVDVKRKFDKAESHKYFKKLEHFNGDNAVEKKVNRKVEHKTNSFWKKICDWLKN